MPSAGRTRDRIASREELRQLLYCLDHQSVCDREMRHHKEAISVAHRSVDYQRRSSDGIGELIARHAVGLALHKAGVAQQAVSLAKAALHRGDMPQVRRWQAGMDALGKQYPEAVACLTRYQFVSKQLTSLKHAIADLHFRRKGQAPQYFPHLTIPHGDALRVSVLETIRAISLVTPSSTRNSPLPGEPCP